MSLSAERFRSVPRMDVVSSSSGGHDCIVCSVGMAGLEASMANADEAIEDLREARLDLRSSASETGREGAGRFLVCGFSPC